MLTDSRAALMTEASQIVSGREAVPALLSFDMSIRSTQAAEAMNGIMTKAATAAATRIGALMGGPSRGFPSAKAWRRAVVITCACRDPAYSPSAGSDPAPGIRLLYLAGDPTERDAGDDAMRGGLLPGGSQRESLLLQRA